MQASLSFQTRTGSAARVLVVASDDRLIGPLTEGLDRLGWRTVTARGAAAALAVLADFPLDAVLIEVGDAPIDALALAARLKAISHPRRLPMLALGRAGLAAVGRGAFDVVLIAPVHPIQAAQRLDSLVRAAVTAEEFDLRVESLAERGRALVRPEPSDQPLRVLTVGEPAPKFLALANALEAGGAEVVGAFTAYTAFDYLHERAFDAVVLWAGETHAEALSIAGGMRRNTRLYHIPTLLYLRPGAMVDLGQAFDRGLSDVLDAETPAADAALRVASLAQAHRGEAQVRRALGALGGAGLRDPATGLFTRDLFAAHLARLTAASRARRRPLSVAVLRIADRPGVAEARRQGWLKRALPQIGAMLGRLVRTEDTAARLSSEVFALALPAADRPAAQAAAERIAAVIACTAFEAAPPHGPFTVEFDVGVAALREGESAASALERAATAAGPRRTD